MLRTRRIPRGEKRRDEIAAVAERVFLELGFNDTTMQIVAVECLAEHIEILFPLGSEAFSDLLCKVAPEFSLDWRRARAGRARAGLVQVIALVPGARSPASWTARPRA